MQPKDTSNCQMIKSETLQRKDNDLQKSTKGKQILQKYTSPLNLLTTRPIQGIIMVHTIYKYRNIM